MDAGKQKVIFLGMGIQFPEINTESQSSILFPHQDNSIAPRTVAWGYGSNIKHVI